MSQKIDFKIVIKRLRSIWIVCYGAITAIVLLGYFVDQVYLPYLTFAFMAGIIVFGNNNLRNSSINCSMMTHYTVYALAVSGVIMLVLNLLNTRLALIHFSKLADRDPNYHVSTIIYPVTAVFYGIALLRRSKPEYCKACKAASGFSIEESIRRNVLHHESKVQLWIAFFISLGLAILERVYYNFFYYNEYISKPDRFFFYFLPVGVYVLSVLYAIMRYGSMQFEISLSLKHSNVNRRQMIRYMVVKGDEVLLHPTAVGHDIELMLWDTPVVKNLDQSEAPTTAEVEEIFRRSTKWEDFRVRWLFNSNNGNENVYHYAVFLPDDATDEESGENQWFSLYELDRMLHKGMISRPFAYELHRIFTITMAWKSYTREGKRLYPIKNYRPTFRLRDFKNWDVDYSDLQWINVAENNEDKQLYGLRKLWRKYISGVDRRWKTKNS